MMAARFPLLSLVAVALASTACGNLSQEDLLFLAAVPTKADVEVRPAGVDSSIEDGTSQTRQALLPCADGDQDLRCMGAGVSAGLNGLSFGILDIIDAITREPPTTRARGRRIWGPFYEGPKDQTFRFEMTRNAPTGEFDGTFAFCIHAALGPVDEGEADDINCDVDVDSDSGMRRVLTGFVRPGSVADARARSGAGELVLDLTRVDDENLRRAGRKLTIDFDNRDGAVDIALVIEGAPRVADVGERTLQFAFHRDADGSGHFYFATDLNVHQPDENKPAREHFEIATEWDATEAGVGEARVSEGELVDEPLLAPDFDLHLYQCWDATGAVVATTSDPDFFVPEEQRGDPLQCLTDPRGIVACYDFDAANDGECTR